MHFEDRVVRGAMKAACILLVPFIIIIGLFTIVAVHDVLIEILTDLVSGDAVSVVIAWAVHLVALGLFVVLSFFCYFFVVNQGWGLFE